MTNPWEKFIDEVAERKRQIEEEAKQIESVLEAYKVFRDRLERLPADLRSRFTAQQEGAKSTTQDLAGKPALECARSSWRSGMANRCTSRQ